MYKILTETTSIDQIVLTMIEPGEKPDLILNGYAFKVKTALEIAKEMEVDYEQWMQEKGTDLIDEHNYLGEGFYDE